MNSLNQFLNQYLNKKIKRDIINFTLILFIKSTIVLIILIIIERDAFLAPHIKIRLINIILILIAINIIFIIFKSILHKYNIFNNSNKQNLAKELINKLPTKDRIINALQIYSKLDLNNPYSDLTTKAVDDLEIEIKQLNINNIKIPHSNRLRHIFMFSIITLISLIWLSPSHYSSIQRIIKKQTFFEKPKPFNLTINKINNKHVFKNDKLEISINGLGNLPKEIELNWINNGKKYNKKIKQNNNSYNYIFKNINSDIIIWATYSNEPIIPYNKYIITSDTLNIQPIEKPRFKDLNIVIEPPEYTNNKIIQHQNSFKKINLLEGSKINIEGIANKDIKQSEIILNQDTINMNIINKNTANAKFEIIEDTQLEIIFSDLNQYVSKPIQYNINTIKDLKPNIIIIKPKNNLKLDESYNISLSIEVDDDYGINDVFLNYYIEKPYYLEQDKMLKQKKIFTSNNKNSEYIDYNWNIENLDIGMGDKIIYWIEAYDNNNKTGPNIGKSNILEAYFPDLEEMYFEIENEENYVEESFEDITKSLDELKNMYQDIESDVLKEQMDWEEQQEVGEMIENLKEISDRINDLDNTIKTISELTEKNNLINDVLGEKIEQLQKMFQEAINPELMKSLQNLQEAMNSDEFKKSLEELNNFEFEMNDLEQQLDRMIELFEQVVMEQKLDEIINKMNEMDNFQKEISDKINNNPSDPNITPMANKQKDNLDGLINTMEETEKLMQKNNPEISEDINQLINSEEPQNIREEIDKINSESNGSEMEKKSQNIENDMSHMINDMNEIISKYQKKSSLEMLNLYVKIIKNLIDMSYEQELIINESKEIKKKSNPKVPIITDRENILKEQYKNIFIQISDLSKKSFHIKPEVSKSFSQIFNNISKTIGYLEQGNISLAKDHQFLIATYINKTILLLIESMEVMQASGNASGYSEYMEAMQKLSQGQQSLNQGMGSLMPIPFGQNPSPGAQAMMQSLMQQQRSLMDQLNKLMNENPSLNGENQGGLGKAAEDMKQIKRDLENQQITQETIDRGKKVYRRLLEHQQAIKDQGRDNKWEAEQNKNKEKLKDNTINQNKNKENVELKELYKTLDELQRNEKITKENKNIIQEYLKLLIKQKIQENEK